jgi:beta-galactosidase
MTESHAQKLYVGANYHPHDSTPDVWQRDIRMMQDAGLTVVRLGHLAWDSYEPEDGKFRFDWFDQAMDLMEEANIKVILDVAVRPAPPWLHRKYPSINVTDASGNVLYPNTRYMEDIGDPDYQDHALRFADALTQRYAHHPALLAFGIDNEPGDGPISYSETVRARYIDWLRRKYETTERLNAAWGGQRWSRRIADFEDVGLPLSGMIKGAPERVLDFRRFISDEVNEFLMKLIELVEENAPGVLRTTNMWYYAEGKYFDYAETAYTGRMTRAGNGFYPGNSLVENEGLRGAMFGIARIQFENTTPFWCTEFTTMTAVPGSIRKSAYASLMLGNQMVCGWTWQTMHAGEEQYLQGMTDWDGQPNRKYDEYRAIAAEFEKIEDFGFPYRPQAEIALAFSFPSQIASASYPETHDTQMRTCFDSILERNLDVRVVEISRSELDYKILIVPGVAVMDEDTAAKIRDFVDRGGTVIMTSYSANVEENGQVFSTRRPGRLDDVFGVRIGSYEEPGLLNELAEGQMEGNVVELTYASQRIRTESPRFDMVEPRTATVIGRIIGLGQDYPVVTANNYGAGRALYVSLPARREVLDPLLDSEIDRMSIRRGPEVPAGVMARNIDARHVLYLNLDGQPKQIVLNGKARSILQDREYQDGFTLAPFDADFIERE